MDFEGRQEEECEEKKVLEQEIQSGEELVTKSEEKEQEQEHEEVESNMSSFEALLDQENTEDDYQDCPIQEKEKVLYPGNESNIDIEKEEEREQEIEKSKTHQEDEKEDKKSVPQTELEPINPKNQEPNKEDDGPLLPECLLLMMCKPKLSMEVSKETWVRGADFIWWLLEQPRKAAKAAFEWFNESLLAIWKMGLHWIGFNFCGGK